MTSKKFLMKYRKFLLKEELKGLSTKYYDLDITRVTAFE